MDDAMVVKISYSGKGRTDEVRGVGLIVRALSTYAIKKLTAEGEVCNKVD